MLALVLDLILGPHVKERCILPLQTSHAQHCACLGGENIIVYVRKDSAGLMVECFIVEVCSGSCLDVFTHSSQYYNSSQFTVVLYTIHSSN